MDLRGAQVSYLHDSEHSWPDVVELDGFVYGSIKVARQASGGRRWGGGLCGPPRGVDTTQPGLQPPAL